METTITYYREGDYLILNLPRRRNRELAFGGRRRNRYLLQHRESIYIGMLFSGSLNAHLEEIDNQAEEIFDLLMEQMALK